MRVQQVKGYAGRRLEWLAGLPEHPRKAAMANLRRGIGKAPGELPELWGIFLDGLPEELQSVSGEPSRAEWAVYLALTLYALHQQGHPLPQEPMHQEGVPFGMAVRSLAKRLAKPDEKPQDNRILRRFNALATASDMRERAQYLRALIQLMRAEKIPLDYTQLAADLYMMQFPDGAARVRLRWGQDFYRDPENVKENDHEA